MLTYGLETVIPRLKRGSYPIPTSRWINGQRNSCTVPHIDLETGNGKVQPRLARHLMIQPKTGFWPPTLGFGLRLSVSLALVARLLSPKAAPEPKTVIVS